MSRENINNIIKELLEELKMKYPDFKGLYLFGSYARGSANEDSDIDIALVFDRKIDWKFEELVFDKIIDHEIENNIFLDAHIFSYGDFNESEMPIIKKIIEEGALYE